MKKILLAILVLAMSVFSFSACFTTDVGRPLPDEITDVTELAAARDIVQNMYGQKPTTTVKSYDVVGSVTVGDLKYGITWTVEHEGDPELIKVGEVDAKGNVKITINEATEDTDYTLKGVISDTAGNSVAIRFYRTVPMPRRVTFDEYANAEKGTVVLAEGTVTGIISKSATKGNKNNCFYIEDETGAFYAFGGDKDPIKDYGLAIGMQVKVKGTKDDYNGTLEIKDYSVEIISEEINEFPAKDITETYKNAKDLKDKALTRKQGSLVTIKGVTLGGVGGDKLDYYYFSLAGKESYVRISSSTCALPTADKDKFIADFKSHFGYKADVTGLITLYNGAFYLTPVKVNAFSNLQLPERNDAEQVAFELDALKFADTIVEDGDVNLLTTGASYKDVKISWESSSASAVVDNVAGKLTVTIPSTPETFTLTATLTKGAETQTKTFEITLSKLSSPEAILDAAFALKSGEKLPVDVTLDGVVTKVNSKYSSQYKNVTVTIVVKDYADRAIECFRMKGPDADKVAVGDNVTVTGIIKNYGGKVEFDSGCTLDACQSQTKIVEEAYALAKDAKLGNRTLTGKITKVNSKYSTQYKNVTVTIVVNELADKAIECFRLKGADAEKLAVGDTITVYGFIKNYGGKVEFDSGCKIVNYAPAKPVEPETPSAGNIEVGVAHTVKVVLNGGKTLYLGNTVKGGRVDCVAEEAQATEYFLENAATAGEYYLYFKKGNVKVYLSVIKNETAGFGLSEGKQPDDTYVINDKNTLVSKTHDRFIGSKLNSTYTNVSAYKSSNLSGSEYAYAVFTKVASGGETVPGGGNEGGETVKIVPEANKDYLLGIYIKGSRKDGTESYDAMYYLDGTVNSKGRLGLTGDKSKAVTIRVEIVDATHYDIYFMDGQVKKYISSEVSKKFAILETDPTNHFTWNADNEVFISFEDRFMGINMTYLENFNIGLNALSNLGGTDFLPVHLILVK